MKKLLIFLAAATAMLAGCSKSELDVENTPAPVAVGKSFVGTFAMNEGTKTTVTPGASAYLVKWESTDQIKVSSNGVTFYTFSIESLSEGNSQAVFTTTEDVPDDFFEQDSYTATFGTESYTCTQAGESNVKHLPMTATAGSQRLLKFNVSVPVMAVTIPSGVSAKGLKVTGGSSVCTITSSTALGTYYIPVHASDSPTLYNISAYSDATCSTEIAESMKMQAGTTMVAGSIYPFTFCPTLEIGTDGTHYMKSYPATYNVRIMNAITSGTVTLAYASGASENPATVDINAKGFAVSDLVINTPSSHVDIANGSSANVTSKTSLSTLVVKPTFTITKTTVENGSIRVEGQSDGSRNVDEIVLAYATPAAMEGTVISVAEVTTGKPVLITNSTSETGSEPITVVGEDHSGSTTGGGYEIKNGEDQNINPMPEAVAKIGTKLCATLKEAFDKVGEGETITLVSDCETGAEYSETSMLALTQPNVTLDLNGYTVTETNNFSWVIAGDNDVVKNGSIVAGYNAGKTCKYHSYALVVGGKNLSDRVTGVQINGVTFTGGVSIGGSYSGNEAAYKGSADVTLNECTVTSGDWYAVCVQPKQATCEKSKVTINSGMYKHTGTTYSNVFGVETGCTALLYGGTYSQDPSEYVAPGYEVSGPTSGYYFVSKSSNVAKIGDKTYSSLEAAFAAVQEGQTITLINDCETGTSYTMMAPLALNVANVTLDLNGYTLTTTNNMSTFIAGDNDIIKNGKIYGGENAGKACGYNSYAINVASEAANTYVTGVKFQNVEFKGGISMGGSWDEPSAPDTKYVGGGQATFEDCIVTSGNFYVACTQRPSSEATIVSGNYTQIDKSTIFWAGSGDKSIKLQGGTYNVQPSAWVDEGYVSVAQGTTPETWKVQPAVAKIGTTYYGTLADAVNAATDGQTITVIKDIALTDALCAKSKTITINVNGKTITSTANYFTNQWTAGEIHFTGAGAIKASGDIRLNGVTAYVIFDETFTGTVDYKSVNNSSGHLQFIGTYFKPTSGYNEYTYTNNYIPEGYFIESITEGTYAGYYKATKITADNACCQVGENYFVDIEKAAKEWNKADGNTLKLLKDATISGYLYPNPGTGKTLTLDLNGKTLSEASGYCNIPVDMGSGTLIVTGNGTIQSNGSYKNIRSAAGCSIEIVNGTFANGIEANGNSLTIANGTFGSIAQHCTTMTISAGTFTGTIQNWSGTTTTINGGTFYEILDWGTLNVTAGEIDHITGQTGGVVNISGGHIATIYKNAATWNITGGTIDKQVD